MCVFYFFVLFSKQGDLNFPEVKGNNQAPCEATNNEAFFSRVESYSISFSHSKPRILSPLMCARYGWINVGCDMLKCSSCQAFLCASLQPTLDIEKFAEISRQLQTQHEKYCPWPDFPCPERFWLVPASEPSKLLTSLLERFQSTCVLAQQLPAMRPELLKSMFLTEDVISTVLQLIEEEQKRKGETPCSESLAVQVSACIVSLCGWGANPALHAMSLPTLSCSYCMRKVGLWNFLQIEGLGGDTEVLPNLVGSSGPTAGPASATSDGDVSESVSPTPAPTTPCRMKLRSQDSTRTDQASSQEARRTFDPLAQHRDWCPWISEGKENMDPGALSSLARTSTVNQQGWKAALDLLMPTKKNSNAQGGTQAQASRKVFAILRQWQVSSSSQ
uniref:Zinc finger, C3HC-type containing 1 n=1 Tax=Xiphophorus couchianus TaxID=32473 RepID=A0A3B5M3H2_9TELE